jgi:cytochrome c-type biogenesis protein CcmH
MKYWLIILTLSFFAIQTQASVNVYNFKDPAQEQRFKKLIEELRCLKCQNQNLADSNAEIALDLKNQAYRLMNKGASDQEIIDYMVNRYGDFVLYRPQVKTSTYLLWYGPFLLLIIAIIALMRFIRVRSGTTTSNELSMNDRERLKKLLQENKKDQNT